MAGTDSTMTIIQDIDAALNGRPEEDKEIYLLATLSMLDRVYVISRGTTTIGTHTDNVIIVKDKSPSKWHAEIKAESVDKPFFIRDLDSFNSTKINYRTLKPHTLHEIKDGDDIHFGFVKARFQIYQPTDCSTPKKTSSLLPNFIEELSRQEDSYPNNMEQLSILDKRLENDDVITESINSQFVMDLETSGFSNKAKGSETPERKTTSQRNKIQNLRQLVVVISPLIQHKLAKKYFQDKNAGEKKKAIPNERTDMQTRLRSSALPRESHAEKDKHSRRTRRNDQNQLGDEHKEPHSSANQNRARSPELLATPLSRSRRTILPAERHKVLFTGERSEVHCELVAELGGAEVDDPKICTVLIMNSVRTTYKFLCSLAQGVPIVSFDWLEDSAKAQYFINWKNYILKDEASESKLEFNLNESILRARQRGILEGYTVYLMSSIQEPLLQELKDMIEVSGGVAVCRLGKVPGKWPKESVIISSREDTDVAKKFIKKAPKRVRCYSPELILRGILKQKLDFYEYELYIN